MRTRRADPARLMELREDQWWTQAELAEKSGVSRATIIEIEKGRNPSPHNQTLFALAKALGVNPTELLEARPSGGTSTHMKPHDIAARSLGHHAERDSTLFGAG